MIVPAYQLKTLRSSVDCNRAEIDVALPIGPIPGADRGFGRKRILLTEE